MYKQKIIDTLKDSYDSPFCLLSFLWVLIFFRPNRLLGLSFLYPLTTIIQLALLCLWFFSSKKVLHNRETKYFVLFALLVLTSGFFAGQTGYARMAFQTMFFFFVTYLTTISFADNFSKVARLVTIFVLGNMVMAFLGLKIGKVLSIPALTDENDYALLLNLSFPFAFFLAEGSQSNVRKIFYLLAAGLFLAGNVISFSRGGFVGLVPVFVYCLYNTAKKRRILLYVLILSLCSAIFVPQSYLDEIRTLKQEIRGEGTEKIGRLYYARLALRMFLDHPVIGIGPNNFGARYVEYIRPGDHEEAVRNPGRYYGRVAHSLYTTILSELGIAGILLFMALAISTHQSTACIRNLERNKQQILGNLDISKHEKRLLTEQIRKGYFLSLAITGGLFGYLVSGAFLSVLYYHWGWTLLTMNVALANALQKTVGTASLDSGKTETPISVRS